jgi:hypothetical protein
MLKESVLASKANKVRKDRRKQRGEKKHDVRGEEDPVIGIRNLVDRGAAVDEIVDLLREYRFSDMLQKAERIPCLVCAIFSKDLVTANEVAQHEELIRDVVGDPWDRQILFLQSLELVFKRYEITDPLHVCGVFQQLYNHDCIEEDSFVGWASGTGIYDTVDEGEFHKQVVAAAQPFLDWLQSEDSESESEGSGSGSEEGSGSGSGSDEEES